MIIPRLIMHEECPWNQSNQPDNIDGIGVEMDV